MTLGPLGEAPLLNDLLGSVELNVLAGNVAIEDGELAARMGALELAGCATSERGDALGVGEGVVKLLGGGAELIRCGHGGGVNSDLAGSRGGSGDGSSLLLGGLRMNDGRSEASGGVHAGSVLEVLGVLGDKGAGKGGQGLAELREDLGANEVLYGLLGGGIGVDLNLELEMVSVLVGREPFSRHSARGHCQTGDMIFLGNVRRTHLPRCRGLPRGW